MKLILPLSVTMPRKTKADRVWILNLNSYRNTHFQILNKAKALYKIPVEENIIRIGTCIPPEPNSCISPPYRFVYTIFPASGRRFDLANVLPIIQKFTDDSLIEMGIIPDDSWKVIKAIDYRFGHIDKEYPRAELEIFHWEEKP